jgi:hypothetical protein
VICMRFLPEADAPTAIVGAAMGVVAFLGSIFPPDQSLFQRFSKTGSRIRTTLNACHSNLFPDFGGLSNFPAK